MTSRVFILLYVFPSPAVSVPIKRDRFHGVSLDDVGLQLFPWAWASSTPGPRLVDFVTGCLGHQRRFER